MHSVDEYFSVFNADESLLDAAFSHPHGLYFRTVQGNAALIGLIDEKIVICFFIVCDQLLGLFSFCHGYLLKPYNYSETHSQNAPAELLFRL